MTMISIDNSLFKIFLFTKLQQNNLLIAQNEIVVFNLKVTENFIFFFV